MILKIILSFYARLTKHYMVYPMSQPLPAEPSVAARGAGHHHIKAACADEVVGEQGRQWRAAIGGRHRVGVGTHKGVGIF